MPSPGHRSRLCARSISSGPGQPDSFICGRIVRQVVEIERGQRKNLELQETRSYRDYIDVRDAVRAYWTLVSHSDFAKRMFRYRIQYRLGYCATPVSGIITLVEEIMDKQYVVSLPEESPDGLPALSASRYIPH